MQTLIKAIFTAMISAGAAHAQTALPQLQFFTQGLSVQEFSRSQDYIPISIPSPAGFNASVGAAVKAAADGEIDTDKAALLAELALKHPLNDFHGRCYQAVWYDVLVKAGFPDDPDVPGTSAFQFAKYAKDNPEWLKGFKLKIIPTPDSFEAMSAGSIVVYDPRQQDAYGHANADHGHIEVIADRDGVRYGCSDACADIGGSGDFLAQPEAKEHVTVFVPVK
ncbi:MAG: hypothetical protein NTX59_06735 [Elusimicrobia bacterium]|nr:hypothetical protein [Elusimicrobiota bacterium]